jgi:hypothetical protein
MKKKTGKTEKHCEAYKQKKINKETKNHRRLAVNENIAYH